MKFRANPFLPLSFFIAITPAVPAATLHWDGTDSTADPDGGSGDWNDVDTNWDDAATAGNDESWPTTSSGDDDAIFGGTAGTVAVDNIGITVNDITFNTANYSITSGLLIFDSLDPDGAGPLTAPLPTITNAVAATISASLEGTAGLQKVGNATLTLSGLNTGITGPLVVSGSTTGNNGGIIAQGSTSVEGFTSIEVQTNSFLALGGVTLAETVPVTLFGGGGTAAPDGALRGATGVSVVNSPVTIANGSVRVGNLGTSTTFNGAITAASGSGFGLLIRRSFNQGTIFTNTGNYWEGVTQLHDGTHFFHPGALPDASNLSNAMSASTWFETSGTFTRGVGTGAGQVQFNATAGRVNGFSARGGDLEMNLGGAGTPVGLVWGVDLFTPAILGFSGPSADGTVNFLNPISLNGANRTIEVRNGSADVDAVLAGTISGPAASVLTKTGSGVLELSAANTHPGGTVIAQSQNVINPLRVSHSNALGTGSLTIGAGGNGDSSRLELAGDVTITNSIPALTSRNNFAPSIVNVTGDNTLTANISSGGGGSRISIVSNEGLLTLSGSLGVRNPHFDGEGDILVSGNITSASTFRSLVKNGAGKLTLTGASNVIETATTINAGTLQIGNGGSTGTPGIAPINNGGTLVFDRDGSLAVAGAISGVGNLVNRGPGVVELNGTLSYSGTTSVENGTLRINGDGSAATAQISVGDGVGAANSAILGGTGSAGGAVVLSSDGAIAPGAGIGILDLVDDVSGNGGLMIEVDGATADTLIVGGALDISAMNLSITTLNAGTGAAFVIVDAASPITGAAFASVSGVPAGYTLTYGYNDGVDSHNIALVATGGTPFTTWASGNGLAGGDAAAEADPDGDGLNNAIEFVIGGQPNPANANASSVGIAPTGVEDGSELVFRYRRTDLSLTEPGILMGVQYGSDLSGWTTAQDGVNGVTVVVTDDFHGAGIDRVEVRIPKTLAVNDRLFARLRVTLP
ncbi:MAG: autotransporter-associated beta strand repeat-containing protein [Akkermansiaceae bacterium]|jgi:autotransporter-associated beta strand protein|nr:autotransporter-associated beta strand repeat-containing protein [Akkermansiaceae bacterium]